jgi:hypothetical protein
MIAKHGLVRGAMRAAQVWRLERLLRWPRAAPEDERAVMQVLRSGRWGGYPAPNAYARQLGERFAQMHSARFGVCVSSGSTALSVAYRALGIRAGDEVIVPALTFSATATSALEIGARVIFVDVDPRTMCLSSSAVIKLANAHDFISKLQLGYDTLVGERGMRLSGGERQRIALARAFLKNAPILILDEPTSSVDGSTEAVILEALYRLMEGRTTFIIAPRLSTLDHCDIRLEIRDGRLIALDAVAAHSQE